MSDRQMELGNQKLLVTYGVRPATEAERMETRKDWIADIIAVREQVG